MDCRFCKKIFSTKSSLNNHQKTAKYCLSLQDKDIQITKFDCEFCDKRFTSNKQLLSHLLNCKNKEKNQELENIRNEKEQELENLRNEKNQELKNLRNEMNQKLENLRSEKDKIIIKLNTQIENFEKQENNYKEQIKELQNKLERTLTKAIEKPTTTNNTVNNRIELHTFPSQREIDRKIESQFNDKYLLDGMKGVVQFVYDHIVKLDDGSIAYACFDTSRQIFKYKDENGNEIKDPKANKLRKMIKPGLLRQSQTLLNYFVDECEYMETRKNNGLDVDGKEYNTMNTLRDKAFEVGCEILNLEDTNKFSIELANLSC
jgi:hypothetical protein